MAAACWAAAAVWSGVSPVDGSLRAVTSPMDDNAAVKPAGSGEARPERKRGQAPDIRMRWVAPCSILIVGLIAASISRDVDVKWSNCPCTVHGTDEEANHQLQLNDVVQATILASECLSRALYPSPIDEVWLSYVFQHSAPGLCPSSACTADQSLYVDRGVVLFIPWSRGLLCEDFSLLIQSLIPIMSQRYKYVTVHPFVNGLFSTPATAALSRFHITELSPVSMRGVLLPPLPIPSSVVPPSAPSRDLLLGFCTQSLNLHKLALRMLYGDADGENITCRWPLLVEDVRCVFRATLSMLRHEWNMTQSPLGVCGSPSADDVVTVMRASELFICPQSTGYGCDLLSSAIQHGAIPVYVWFSSSSFIHGHTLPYHHSLPWADMAVSIHWSQLHKLQRILQGITHGDRARRRARLAGYYQTHFSPDGITAQIASWLRSPDHSGLEIIPVDVEKRSNANEGITVLYPNPLGEIRQAVAHPGVGRDVACVAACSGGHLSLPSSDADDLQRVRSAVCLNNCAVLSVDSAMAPSATVMDVQLSDRGRLVRDVLLRYRLFERSRRDLLLDITSEGTLPTQLRIDSTRIVTIREATMQVLREVTRNDVDAIERWRPSVEAQAADFIDQLVRLCVCV